MRSHIPVAARMWCSYAVVMRVLLLIALAVAGCSRGGREEVPEMTVDEVARDLDAKQIQAVDVCHSAIRARYGTIPGAILLPEDDDYPVSLLPADKAAKLVFYCSDPG
jgi:hypothetical protein